MATCRDTCLVCEKPFTTRDPVISCNECNAPFHLGEWTNVRTNRTNWSCQQCKNGAKLKENRPVDNDSDKLDNISNMLEELALRSERANNVNQTPEQLENSLQLVSGKYDKILSELASQKQERIDLRKAFAQM